jgi:3-hydroxyisobutyrate dehydrogenase-like beta-hydroxyacid dehydrogenase
MKTIVGLIGVGMMGVGIASNLVKHGHALHLLDHPGNQPVDALLAAGARLHTSMSTLAREVDVLLVCVTGSPQVEAVLIGPGGALEHLRRGAVVIDLSTSIPSSTERIAERVTAAGCSFLDAAMTRTPKEAAEGRLNLLVGGEAELLERCRPVLASFAETILHAGVVGAGHRMKLLHNFVSLGLVTLIAEAAACAQQAGVAPGVFVDVLARGGGGGIALDRLKPFLLTGDVGALRFSVSNARKDLDYYGTMAAETGADRTVAQAVFESLNHAAEAEPGAMLPELVRLIAAR